MVEGSIPSGLTTLRSGLLLKVTIGGVALAVGVVLLSLAAWDFQRFTVPAPSLPPLPLAAGEALLYGRVTTHDGTVYEGRLRWGGSEEALWGHYFNGFKGENPWAGYVASDRLPKERLSLDLFGIELLRWERPVTLGRPFMARFGHLARIEPRVRDVWVTLKSGTVVRLDRFGADDLNDGVRVWDSSRGVVDLTEWRVRSIEFLPSPSRGGGSFLLHGTVRTRQGDFTGLIQWDRQDCLGSDEIDGDLAGRALSVRFDAIRSIARHSRDSSLVTLRDGGELLLTGTREVGRGNRGIYVDDRRYGRVLISWDAFQRADFDGEGAGPAYDDFPAGRPLVGRVTTRSGRRLSGRLVYDLDESETTDTLDAPWQGVDYTLPFALVASIELPGAGGAGTPHATVSLRSGETLRLELTGDLGRWHAGLLVFDGGPRPEYVPWAEVVRVDFDRPADTRSPGGRQ